MTEIGGASRVRRLAVAGLAATVAVVVAPVAAADIPHPTVVIENPVNHTPELVAVPGTAKPIVDAIAVSGDTVFAGGRFTRVSHGTDTYDRTNVVMFDADTGAVSPANLDANNRVWAMATIGNWVYIGGQFTAIGGTSKRSVVRVDATTGEIDPGFTSAVKGRVNALEAAPNGLLYVGGSFSKRLVALDPVTGADTGAFDLTIADPIPGAWGSVSIIGMSVNTAGTKLVATGNFRQVDGQARSRFFMADISGTDAVLDDWYYPRFASSCSSTHPRRIAYLQGIDFAPTDDYFVVVATGQIPLSGDKHETVCDGAGRFDMDDDTQPQWINYTGGDSVWGVSVTGAAVYVQGHFQWLDNPDGWASMPRGDAVRRLGIGAIDPGSGLALDWDPAKKAQIGSQALVATPDGLWVGSDSTHFAGEPHRGIAFVPLP
ncbi:hypothetical protein [Nocardioides coralli]|uniref:hypothetical protein n=1 Tax=Nocardioides coralli TaxID=2872154 RepID=UPI001CA3B6E7|nr:hypothetical protein [Nocardioides coralli]QZY29303.1 hypothetical protein K6T13_00865 [Nocardioides coralli]